MEKLNNIFEPSIIKNNLNNAEQISLSSELFKSRKLFLIGEINAESMAVLMQSLMYLESISDNPIELYINSAGGTVASGMAVYRYMTEVMRSPIHTYCIGIAASMGAILYLAGEKRYMYEGTKIVIHDPSSVAQTYEKPGELKERLESLEKTKDMICHIIADRTGHPVDEISEIIKNDKIYDADEALEFGLATDIIRKEAEDYHNNPFVSKPDGNRDTNRGLPPPLERYQTESIDKSDGTNVILTGIPKALVRMIRKDDKTMYRFGFSYRIELDKTIYANVELTPSQVRSRGYKYVLHLGAPDTKYTCTLSEGDETVILTASEIAKVFNDNRSKYFANRLRRSVLGA